MKSPRKNVLILLISMPLKIEKCFLFHEFKDVLVRHVLQLPNVNKIKFQMEEVFKALKVI